MVSFPKSSKDAFCVPFIVYTALIAVGLSQTIQCYDAYGCYNSQISQTSSVLISCSGFFSCASDDGTGYVYNYWGHIQLVTFIVLDHMVVLMINTFNLVTLITLYFAMVYTLVHQHQ